MKKQLFVLFVLVCSSSYSFDSYDLGTLSLSSSSDDFTDLYSRGEETYSLAELRHYNHSDVSEVSSSIAGVSLSANGARNERTLSIRGFDSRQVPVLLDGVPLSLPYDGNIDLGRIDASDLSSIEVSKGSATPLLGPNSLGGVINLVTKRPNKKYEAEVMSSTSFRQGVSAHSQMGRFGGRSEHYYYQFSLMQKKQNDLRPSAQYSGMKPFPHSETNDKKLAAIIGWTPNSAHEYSLNYIQEMSSKDIPTYAGDLSSVQKRYWTYPIWNKRSYYFIGKWRVSDAQQIKARAYWNFFDNTLDSFDDATYSSQTKLYAFRSTYNDDALGAQIEHVYEGLNWTLSQSFHFKKDHHREYSDDEPIRHFVDDLFSYGLEAHYFNSYRGEMILGTSVEWRKSLRAESYDSGTDSISSFKKNHNQALNPSITYIQPYAEKWSLRGTVAKKTRFPTMKDRYSYRLGKSLPNPDLKQEESFLYEVGSTYLPHRKLKMETNLFYYDIDQTLLSVNINPSTTQVQNTGKSSVVGGELLTSWKFASKWDAKLSYLYLHKRDRSESGLIFTDSPQHHGNFKISYFPHKRWVLNSMLDVYSSRYSDTAGLMKAHGFALWHLEASYHLLSSLQMTSGVKNVMDRNYEYSSGYPERGRELYFNLTYSL